MTARQALCAATLSCAAQLTNTFMTQPVRTSDIVAAYRRDKRAEELRDDWFYVLYRVFSWVTAPLLARLGVRPAAVTLTGALVALCLPWLAWRGGPQAWWMVGVGGFLFSVLDALDGDLARATGTCSPAGAWLDAQVDLVYRVLMYFAVGLAAGTSVVGSLPVPLAAVGLLAAALVLVARAARPASDGAAVKAAGDAAGQGTRASGWHLVYGFFSSLDHLLPVLVLVLGALGALPVLVWWLLVYSAADYVSSFWMGWRAASR